MKRELYDQGRAAWPTIDISFEQFGAFIGGRTPPALTAERAAELYLACACANRHDRAIAELEKLYFPAIEQALRKRARSSATTEEALQAMRETLFVSRPEQQPGIAGFSGVGPLAGWLRVIAMRTAFRVSREETRVLSLEPMILERMSDDTDPELKLLRDKYGPALTEAMTDLLREVFQSLPDVERKLLHYRYIEGQTVDQIAAIRGTHRATVARWLVQAEETLVEETLRRLGERFGTTPGEIKSVMRLVRSRLPISIRAVFER